VAKFIAGRNCREEALRGRRITAVGEVVVGVIVGKKTVVVVAVVLAVEEVAGTVADEVVAVVAVEGVLVQELHDRGVARQVLVGTTLHVLAKLRAELAVVVRSLGNLDRHHETCIREACLHCAHADAIDEIAAEAIVGEERRGCRHGRDSTHRNRQ